MSETRIFRKRSFFLQQKESHLEEVFLSICFSLNALSFEYFCVFQLVAGRRTSKNKILLHENGQVSVIKYLERMGMEREREREREKEKYKKYIIRQYISGCTR
jgi:hypothetical protein